MYIALKGLYVGQTFYLIANMLTTCYGSQMRPSLVVYENLLTDFIKFIMQKTNFCWVN